MTVQAITALNNEIEKFLRERGAMSIGFATLETLAGGPPSTDLNYILPGSRSAISFALPLDRDKIRDFLSKKDQIAHETDDREVNQKADTVAQELANWLIERGYDAIAVARNNKYREEIKNWQTQMLPDLSHRYIAVRSGVGSFGWSGNVGIKGWGPAIILNTVVTNAELMSTAPVPPEESFCTQCKLCAAACLAGFFDAKESTEVKMGGENFTYSKRNRKERCHLVCGGFAGLHKSKKWSTWSPGRVILPDDDNKLFDTLIRAIYNYTRWPERSYDELAVINNALKGVPIRLTCGMCQKVCRGNDEENRENYNLLTNSGCVIQKPDGELIVLPPEEAQALFDSFPRKHRRKYS